MDLAAPGADTLVPDRGPTVFAVTTATLALASVFVSARIYCRHFIVRNVAWDDKAIVLAWLIAFFLTFTIDVGVLNGIGKFNADISDESRRALRYCKYVFSILYNPALMATKTSILIFYLHLARNTQVVLRYASWATLVVVNLAGLVLTLLNIFRCSPIRAAWTLGFSERESCIPLLTQFICAAPINIITDLAILVLPIPVLTGLRLPARQKVILILAFTLGIFVTIVDVVRIYYLQLAVVMVTTATSTGQSPGAGRLADVTWNIAFSLMWSAVEVNIGIACACIPTVKPLILRLFPGILYNSDGSQKDGWSKGSGESQVTLTQDPAGIAKVAPPVATELEPTQPKDGTVSRTVEITSCSGPATHTDENPASFEACTVKTSIYVGFNVKGPKSMVRANSMESLKYCAVVSTLFFLWGLSYGLLDTLNSAVATINNMSAAQSLGLSAAYFGGGYFFGPLLVGQYLLRRERHDDKAYEKYDAENISGYKATFIVGLCIYGTGTIIFWPSAVANSYGGFFLSNLIVGFGLSVLEVGANSFMILCGPPQYGETRLLLAQGIQGVGSIVNGLLGQRVLLKEVSQMTTTNGAALINVQWAYLGITLLCVALGLFFFYLPLPEVSDDELAEAAERLPVDAKTASIGGLQLRTVSLILAVFAQYMYVAAQESGNLFFRDLLMSIVPEPGPGESQSADKPPGLAISIPDYMILGRAAYTVSRLLMSYLTYLSVSYPRLPRPRTYLAISVILFFALSLLRLLVRPSNPELLVIPAILVFFAEAPIWPLLFAIGLRGQGRRTKLAAVFITMGGSGAGFIPFIVHAIKNKTGTVQAAFAVVIAVQFTITAYPAFLLFSRDARRLVDPVPVGKAGDETRRHRNGAEESGRFNKWSKGVAARHVRLQEPAGYTS